MDGLRGFARRLTVRGDAGLASLAPGGGGYPEYDEAAIDRLEDGGAAILPDADGDNAGAAGAGADGAAGAPRKRASTRLRAGTLSGLEDTSHLADPEAALEEIGDEVFTDEFDLVKVLLQGMPGDREALAAYLMQEQMTKDIARDAALSRLSKAVLANYDNFVKGMKQIQEVDMDVSRATIHVSNALRKLRGARANLIIGAMKIVHRRRKRERLADVRRRVRWLRDVTHTEATIGEAMGAGDYPRAVELCVELNEVLDEPDARRYQVLQPLRQRMETALPGLRRQLNTVLEVQVAAFAEGRYAALMRAYLLLDRHMGLGVRTPDAGADDADLATIPDEDPAQWAALVGAGSGGTMSAESLGSGLAMALGQADSGEGDDASPAPRDPGCIGSLPDLMQEALLHAIKTTSKAALVNTIVRDELAASAEALKAMRAQAARGRAPPTTAAAAGAAASNGDGAALAASSGDRAGASGGADGSRAADANDAGHDAEMTAATEAKARTKAERLQQQPFASLSAGVPERLIVPVVSAVFAGLCKMFHSHYMVSQWHRRPFDKRGSDAKTGMEFLHRCGITDRDIAPDVADGDADDDGAGGGDVGDGAAAAAASGSSARMRRIRAATAESRAATAKRSRQERARLMIIRDSLLACRPVVWHHTQQRVVALVFAAVNAAGQSVSLPTLVRVLSLFARLIVVAEEYAASDSVSLRGSLRLLCRQHFDATHRSAFDAVKALLNREQWQRMPITEAAADKIIASAGSSASIDSDEIAAALWASAGSDLSDSSGSSDGDGGEGPALPQGVPPPKGGSGSFLRGMAAEGGIPFGPADAGGMDGVGGVGAPGAAGAGAASGGAMLGAAGAGAGDDDDEEDEPEVVDEDEEPDDDADDRGDEAERERSAAREAEEVNYGSRHVVTASANGFAARTGTYLTIMHALPAVAVESFVGLTQLFEYYMYTTAVLFLPPYAVASMYPPTRDTDGTSGALWYGDPTAIEVVRAARKAAGVKRPGSDGLDVSDIDAAAAGGAAGGAARRAKDTPFGVLSSLLARVRDEIAANRGDTSPGGTFTGAGSAGAGAAGAAPGGVGFTRPATSVDLDSEASTFGLKERIVGAGSLEFLLETLEKVRPRIASRLPASHASMVDNFYDRAHAAVEQYEALMCHAISPLLMPEGTSIPGWIGAVKWDGVHEVLEHNTYAKQVITALDRAGATLTKLMASGALPRWWHGALWGAIVGHVMERMVEGFSRVKKCTTEGRGLMAMDVLAVYSKAKSAGPPPPEGASMHYVDTMPRNKSYVDQYIQAFYFEADKDVLEWVRRNNGVYRLRHMMGLVEHGVGAGKKKKALKALVTQATDVYGEHGLDSRL